MVARVVFQQTSGRRLVSGLLLAAGGAWFIWASVTAADIQTRGLDFRETPSRGLGLILGLVPLVIGADYLIRLARSSPDVIVDGNGLRLTRMFFQRDGFIAWTDITHVEDDQLFAGFKTLPILKVFGSGKPLRVVLDRFDVPPERVRQTIVDAWARGASAPNT